MTTKETPTNPANPSVRRVDRENRRPMNLPRQKLAVPGIPGYWLYWHLGKNVQQALAAGYTYVERGEVDLNQFGIANAGSASGSASLGSRVCVNAGVVGSDEDGSLENEELYLMKLPEEWHQEDMDALTAENEKIAVQLRTGMIGADQDPDRNKRFMKEGQHLFYPKRKA